MMIEIQDLEGIQKKDVLLKRTNIKKAKARYKLGWQPRCQSHCRALLIFNYIVLPKSFYKNSLVSLL